jgi:hypothetical protein
MLLISTGRATLRLGCRLGSRNSGVVGRRYTTKPLPADLAALIPTLEDLGLGSGDNGTPSPICKMKS